MTSDKSSHFVGLHLFVEGQEICHKDYHYCIVSEHHMLLCDLRIFFDDEESKSLDACLGDEWKTIQVQFESSLIIDRWGVYVYKQKTNTDDIGFGIPYSTNYVPMPLQSLVTKTSPNQKIKHIQSLDLVEAFGQFLNTFRSEQYALVAYKLLRWCRNTRDGPPSACVKGASLMQEHEEYVLNIAKILEMLMRNVVNHTSEIKVQNAGQLVVELLTSRAQHWKEKGHELFHINMNMPIILEECECHPCTSSKVQFGSSLTVLQQKKTKAGRQRAWREAPSRRYGGSLKLEEGDPLVWTIWKGKESVRLRVSNMVILLKCQHCSLVEASSSNNVVSLDKDFKDPVVQELLRRIEKDAMTLNESQSMLKAYIVPMDITVCNKYMMEMAIIRGQEILGRFGSDFNKTPYGKLRMENTDGNQNQEKMSWTKSSIRWIGHSKWE